MFVKDNPEEDDATLEKEVLVLKPRKTLGKEEEEEEEGAGREAAGLGFDSFEIVAIVIQITNRARGGREAEKVFGLVKFLVEGIAKFDQPGRAKSLTSVGRENGIIRRRGITERPSRSMAAHVWLRRIYGVEVCDRARHSRHHKFSWWSSHFEPDSFRN